uniref:Putative mantle 1 n=1 Tax=Pinctada fucata TaxID=50426 RepID=A0A194AM40_PINFU
MKCLTSIATVFVIVHVLNVMSCDARRESWWRRTTKSIGAGFGSDGAHFKVGIQWRRKKRDTENQGKFNLKSKLNPCELASYDKDMGGLVKNTTIEQIFKIAEVADVFFAEADENGDAKISASEFDAISSKINKCQTKQ